MAMDKDLLALFQKEFKDDATVSRVSEDIRGKVIVLYGGNNLGKSLNASKFPNPIFLPCEKGLNAINGALVLKTQSWGDLKKNGKKLTGKKFTEALKKGATISVVIDGIERIGNYVKDYLCSKYDVATIGKANGGYGAWEEYSNLVWSFVDNLISVGYTVVFIGHEKWDNNKEKYVIDGDERVIKPIRDNADCVVYLKSNGVDEEGKTIHSSAYLAETNEYFARTRFTYMDTYIEDFTAENLINTIVEGIKRQNEAEGFDSVSFEEQQEIYDNGNDSFEDVVTEIKELFEKMSELGEEATDEYMNIVEEHLGDVPVSQATAKQLEALKCIRDDLVDYLEEAQ